MRVRQFLLSTYALNHTYHNWELRRWEGQWFWGQLSEAQHWTTYVRLWENERGQLVGVAHPERRPGNLWLQIHPDYRHLEEEMLRWGEAHLAASDDSAPAKHKLQVEAFDYDRPRQQLLAQQGYTQTPWYGYLRWRLPTQPLPAAPTTAGYVVRALRPGVWSDTERYAAAVRAVFPRSAATAADEARFQTSPSFRYDLHLVAEAADGSFAAFAGLTFEDVNRTAVFEPVGTHPDHRGKGLAQAVMVEGLRRLQALNASMVYVGTGDMIPANRLYESLGFTHYHISHVWEKVW
ncbi:MAG: GNAT family N-acetyltransferase [Chloroflexi bacterium]|nr:GNAT family N-acetyltransferase [Chloroflexota bacterium]